AKFKAPLTAAINPAARAAIALTFPSSGGRSFPRTSSGVMVKDDKSGRERRGRRSRRGDRFTAAFEADSGSCWVAGALFRRGVARCRVHAGRVVRRAPKTAMESAGLDFCAGV